MTEPDHKSSPAGDERVWGIYIATAFGSFFLLFLSGLVFQTDDPEWTVLSDSLAILFTGWSGVTCAGGIAMLLRRRWGDRLVESSLAIGAVAPFTAMVGSTCWKASQRILGPEPAQLGDAAALVLVLLWAGFGSLIAWSDREGKEPPGLASWLLLWPFFLLLKDSVAFGALFVPLLLFVGGGEWLGSRYGHPYLGAAAGLASLIAVFAVLARLSRRWI